MLRNGWTPLHFAAIKGAKDVLLALIAKGATVNATIPYGPLEGWTPLHSAIMSNDLALVDALLEAGANPSLTDKDGNPPLHIAALKGYKDISLALIAKGAKMDPIVNNGPFKGWTPLHLAAKFERLETVEALLKAGADPTVTDDNGNTPLNLAIRN